MTTEHPSFYLDENIEVTVAPGARRRGVVITSARDENRLGLDDGAQLSWAAEQGMVIVTHDRGFEERHWRGEPHSGIVYFPKGTGVGLMIEWLTLIAAVYTADEMVNQFEWAG